MALSYCSGMKSIPHSNPGITSVQETQSKLSGGDILEPHHCNFGYDNSFLNELPEPSNKLFPSEINANLLSFLDPPPDNLISVPPDILPYEEFESLRLSKCQRIYDNRCNYQDITPVSFDGYASRSCPAPKPLPEPFVPLPEFQIPPTYSFDHADAKQKPRVALSPQSVAARQRRRKIAEKLQELGKVVPGGTKLNTSEMLQAAHKYVKYLQAQIGIMALMKSSQEAKESIYSHEFQGLLASTVVQEKMYAKERCLVPQKFVQAMAGDSKIRCKPSIFKEIHHLIEAQS